MTAWLYTGPEISHAQAQFFLQPSAKACSSGRQRSAHDCFDDLSRSTDGAGAAGYDCEQIARSIGCQSCQELWQVAAGWDLSQGRNGEDSPGQGREQLESSAPWPEIP